MSLESDHTNLFIHCISYVSNLFIHCISYILCQPQLLPLHIYALPRQPHLASNESFSRNSVK